MISWISCILIIVGMVAGNYIWQSFFPEPNYLVAFERSYFQVVAAIILFLWLEGKKIVHNERI